MIAKLGEIFLGVALAVYLLLYLAFLITGIPLHFGEAVSFEGLLRLLYGLPFASLPTTPPISLSPYTPLFLLPHWGLGKLFSLVQFQEVLVLARILQILFLLVLFALLNRIRNQFWGTDSSWKAFSWCCLIVFLYSPPMELALRPDTLSFLSETGGVFGVLLFLRFSRERSLALAGILFGLALAFKLNSLGGSAGTLLFLVISQEWKGVAVFLSSFLFAVLLFLGAQWWFLGSSFDQNILLSIQSRLWSFGEAVEVYKKLFDLFLFPLAFYFFLIFRGLSCWKRPKEASYVRTVLLVSFVSAFLGQLKWGAFHNYFLGVLYLGLLPASCALFELFKHHQKATQAFLIAFVGLFMIRDLSIPVKIWQEKRFFQELRRLQELVAEHVPDKMIYTNAEPVFLGFVGKAGLGVLTEELFFTTPKLSPFLPQAQAAIETKGGFGAFITYCAYPPPTQWGFHQPEKWRRVQTGRFCFFY